MNQKRTPAGVPTGGEFAGNEHDEAPALLGSEKNTLWQGGFDRLGQGDSMLLPMDTTEEFDVQSAEVHRDYSGDLLLVTTRSEPLAGSPELSAWAHDHEGLYDDFLDRDYLVQREALSGRLVMENRLRDDETDEGEVIRRGFLSDREHYLTRHLADGTFVERVAALRENNTIDVSAEDVATPDEAMREAKEAADGGPDISGASARALAKDITRGVGTIHPKLAKFGRTGCGHKDELLREVARARTADKIDSKTIWALEGWLEQ